jgi:WhiB family redox-sensing transcriptional regulator
MGEPNWREQANCRDVAQSVFFHPDDERGPMREKREAYAKRFCQGCPVRTACLDEAFTAPQDYGTWGGLSERERRNIRNRRTVNVREYLRLRAAGVPPETAAAITSASVETEVAVSA